MSSVDASRVFHRTRDGRRVLGLQLVFNRLWYLVSDRDAARVERRLQLFFALSLLVVLPLLVLVVSPTNVWLALVLGGLWLTAGLHLGVVRGLPRVTVPKADLVISNEDQVSGIGKPWLWLVLLALLAMAFNGAQLFVSGGPWWTGAGALMFFVFAVQVGREIIRSRTHH